MLLPVPPAAEIIKRRVPGIYQTTEISSITIVDVWEPKEEGLDTLETKRRVSVISITLSKEPLDEDHIGFQPPLPADQVGQGGVRLQHGLQVTFRSFCYGCRWVATGCVSNGAAFCVCTPLLSGAAASSSQAESQEKWFSLGFGLEQCCHPVRWRCLQVCALKRVLV